MADPAIAFAILKLGDLAIEKVSFLNDVPEQVKWLKRELQMMQSCLNEATEKQDDQRIRTWISDLRELAQDADDVIETFILKVDTPRRTRGCLGRYASSPRHVYRLHVVGSEIKQIKSRLEALDECRQRYEIGNPGDQKFMSGRSKAIEQRRRLPSSESVQHVVGFDEDVEMLLRKAILDGRKEGLSVASIVGMGGIGKSTLAMKVYDHKDVVSRFKRRAWVVISSNFSPREIMKELAWKLLKTSEKNEKEVSEMLENSEAPMLQEMLREHLKGQRYFVVLDDLWEDTHWEYLRSAFPVEGKSSRLLITSRTQDIPHCARYVHVLKTSLDPKQGLNLLLNKAFIKNTAGGGGKISEELEDIGSEIVRKCDGLPLAITMAGVELTKGRHSKSEWEKVLKETSSHMGTHEILELSYHNLEAHLKSCFLCLSFFKEDATICAKKLVHVWVAQGLVPLKGKDGMEEVARSYLDELIKRNMVYVKDMTKDERVKSIQIHNLLRQLSITKAEEEIGFEILKEGGTSRSLDKSRHRVVYCSTKRFLDSESHPNKRIRSLFFHGAGDDIVAIDISPSYWKSFELLRILDFDGFGLEDLPHAVGDLIGLRYLGLRNNKIKKLQSSLSRLKNLEVLDIANNRHVKVSNVISEMNRLRHLYMSSITCKGSLKIGTLKNLQTLSYVPFAHRIPKYLVEMTSLRKLGIEFPKETPTSSELFTSVATLESLTCLSLRWLSCSTHTPSLNGLNALHRVTRLKLQGKLIRLTDFPPNISYLTLAFSDLHEDPMPVLEKFPKLVYLNMNDAYHGEEMVISKEGFPKLKVLYLREMCGLRNIQVDNGAMPELKRLEVDGCGNVERQGLKIVVRNPEVNVPWMDKVRCKFGI